MSGRRNARKRRERSTRRQKEVIGSPVQNLPASKLLGTTDKPQFTLEPPRFATSKTWSISPVFPPDHPAHGTARDGAGANGEYQVTFVLGVPGFWNPPIDRTKPLVDQGDSLLEVEPQITSLEMFLENPEQSSAPHRAIAAVNEHHRLKYIQTTLKADGFNQARKLAHDLIMPAISRLAYVHDAAVDVIATELVDRTSQAFSITMKQSGSIQAFSGFRGRTSVRQEKLLAVYRHGISSTEPAFQALSFFRVIEACYRLRGNRISEVKARGEQPNEPSERFPDNFQDIQNCGYEEGQEVAFAPYLGLRFTRVRDLLSDQVRNLLAHLDIHSESLHLDDFDNTSKIESVVPVLHYIARELVSTELEHLRSAAALEVVDSPQ